jgi:hypothetical protein
VVSRPVELHEELGRAWVCRCRDTAGGVGQRPGESWDMAATSIRCED